MYMYILKYEVLNQFRADIFERTFMHSLTCTCTMGLCNILQLKLGVFSGDVNIL